MIDILDRKQPRAPAHTLRGCFRFERGAGGGIATMPVTISVSETKYMGLLTPSADEPPIWGVIFQINRDDGIGTAIGVTVRCDDKASAPEQALPKLRSFLSEASSAAEALTLSESPEPAENEVFEAPDDQAAERSSS